jgi:hypothetical protein
MTLRPRAREKTIATRPTGKATTAVAAPSTAPSVGPMTFLCVVFGVVFVVRSCVCARVVFVLLRVARQNTHFRPAGAVVRARCKNTHTHLDAARVLARADLDARKHVLMVVGF